MKKAIKILSVFLATIMFFSVFSAAEPVLAVEIQQAEAQSEATDVYTETEETFAEDREETEETEGKEASSEIIGEDLSRRDEVTKHFIMSDGTRKAVTYSEPVHFLKDGEWKDIDNTLSYDKEKGEYTNKENSFKVAFNEELKSEELFTIESEGYTLSWEYISDAALKRTPKAGVEKKEKNKNRVLERVNKTKSSVSYKGFEADSTLEYVVTGTGVKENIILSAPTKRNEFSFKVSAPGLTLEKNADGSISAKAADNCEIFYVPAPYMYDSDNAYSDNVRYEITQLDKNTYTITVIADKAWLKEKDRVYPVTIDPAIQTKKHKSAITATFVASGSPNENFSNKQDVYIGVESSNYLKCRALFKFDLPQLNKGDMVVGARLSLLQYASSFYTDSMPQQQISAHLITGAWDESTVKWANQPAYNTTVLDYAYIKRNVNEWKLFDVTRVVKGWYEGTYVNNGILIKKEVEDGSFADVAARGIFWSDSANGVDEYYPYIEITYRNNKGVEGYWSYSDFSQASCGVGSVNDYSGNLVYEIPVASTVSEVMPVNLSVVYNGYAANEVYSIGKNGSYLTTPGRGWRLNIQETLLPSTQYGLTEDASEKYPYVYTDGDGTEHYIQKVTKKDSDGDEVVTYEDEDGLGLTLDTQATASYKYKLTDKQDNVRLFNDKGNLTQIEDANGNSINIVFKDTNGDGTCENDKIDYVEDGASHRLTFDYYENTNFVKTVTDGADRVVRLGTVNGYLVNVDYYDETVVYLEYESNVPGLINYVWSSDKVGVNFDYTSSKTGYRVRKVTEFAATQVYPAVVGYAAGRVVTFNRVSHNTTVIRSGGIDGITYDTSTAETTTDTANFRYDDIVTTLQFDNFGRTVSQQVCYGNAVEVGAGSYNYGNKTGSENKITDAASLGKNTYNLIKNSTCETLDYWTQNKPLNVNTALYQGTALRHTGKKCLIVNTGTSLSVQAGASFKQNVSVEEGKTYTLSAFVRTKDLVKTTYEGASGSCGAYVQMNALNSAGTVIGSKVSPMLTENTNTNINDGWRRLSATYTMPTGTAMVTVHLCLRNYAGLAYFDDVQLEEGTTPNNVNLLQNANFEEAGAGLPVGWSVRASAQYTTDSEGTVLTGVTDGAYKNGGKSLVITGEADAYKGFAQNVPVQANENDTYILSGWARGYAVNSTYHSHYEKDGERLTDEEAADIFEDNDDENDKEVEVVSDSKFEIAVQVGYTKTDEDGNVQSGYVYQEKKAAEFNTTVTSWQYASTPIVLKYEKEDGDNCTYTPSHIVVMPRYNLQENHAYFDHLQLIKDVAQSYVYDKEGNIISVSANAEQKNDMTYDPESNDLKEYYDAEGNKTTFNYDGKHNVTKVTSPKGIKTEYTYNSRGQVEATETVNVGGVVKIKTETNYTDNGAYVSEVKDQFGNATTYTYDTSTGVVTKITDAKGVVTSNGYSDDKSELTSVTAGYSKVSYNYGTDNRLDDIVFANVNNAEENEKYSFEYDDFGRVLKTKVGTTALSTNTYNKDMLTNSTYGNGDAVSYGYAYSGLTASVGHNNNGVSKSPAYTWDYSSNGMPRTHKDYYSNLKYDYNYDSIGRLIRTDITDGTTGNGVGSTEYGYDIRGNLTSLSNAIGGRAYTQYYRFSNTGVSGSIENGKDGLPTRYIALGTNTDYTYDSLNRLTLKSVKVSDSVNLNNVYSYLTTSRNEAGKSYATTRLGAETVVGVTYGYTYDAVGNITGITRAGGDYKSYTYDALGELKSETQHTLNRKATYFYTPLGNIYAKIVAKTNPTPEEGDGVVSKIAYGYSADSDAGWNNLLTSLTFTDYTDSGTQVRTETIDYDAIGNPVSYRGAAMSWFGRQMRTYSKGTTSASFNYDADGLRSEKVVNGVKTTYQYVGDKLYYENIGDNKILYYFYDSYGNLSQIYYTVGSTYARYYVATNAQGDVVAIYNSNGVKVGAYDYDAWGNTRMFVVTQDANGNNVHTQINPETQYLNHIINVNPIRYRGYYYDSDLDLYYLQSRYYDSEIGRFINSDNVSDSDSGVLGYNTYIYASNNPVTFSDPSGHSIILSIVLGAVFGAAVSAAFDFVGQYRSTNGFTTGSVDRASIARSALIGGIFGGISGGTGGVVSQIGLSGLKKHVVNAVVDGCINVAETAFSAVCSKTKLSVQDIAISFASGVASSAFSSAISNRVQSSNIKNFKSLTKNQKKITLNSLSSGQHITRSMITNNEYMVTDAYQRYISSGTLFAEQCSSVAVTITFNLFEEYMCD